MVKRVGVTMCVLTVVLVLSTAGALLAQKEPGTYELNYTDLRFSHVVEMFQKAAPEAVFVMAPGVAERLTTCKAPRRLSLEDAITVASAAADIDVERAGGIYIFRLRRGAVTPPPPRHAPQVEFMPIPPPPTDFPGARNLVDLQVENASLDEVVGKLAAAGGVEIALHPKELSHVRVTASVYKRPVAEVLGYLVDQAGLTYVAEGTTLYVVPKPSLTVSRRYIPSGLHLSFRGVEHEERPVPPPMMGPRPAGQPSPSPGQP